MAFVFHVVCSKCKKTSEVTQDHKVPEPKVSCGDCLWNNVEIVPMIVVKIIEDTAMTC